jgi:hypothetical protein
MIDKTAGLTKCQGHLVNPAVLSIMYPLPLLINGESLIE